MSDRIKVVSHKSQSICLADYSGLKPQEIVDLLPLVSKIMIGQKIRLICNDVTNTTTDDQVKKAVGECIGSIVQANGPVHSAFVGIRGIQKILANATQKGQYFASDQTDALDWLVRQVGK